MIRRFTRRLLIDRLVSRAQRLDLSQYERPTLVLAPHPDDETLGCGGLVARLRQRAVPVSIVFMTDGAASHADVHSSDLAVTRRREAVEASSILGVEESDLHFLGHPDGALHAAETTATRQLAWLFDALAPMQVLLPHPFEPNADHSATFRIADLAARQRGVPVDGLLFAVWLWDQWPWTNPLSAPRGRHGRREMIDVARRGRLGFGLGRQLTHVVEIGDLLDVKRAALAAHASQMSRPPGKEDWLTLGDVARGDWLDLLLRDSELYSPVTLGA